MRRAPVVTFPTRSLRDRVAVYGSLSAILLGFVLAPAANAVVIFSENFEDITLTTDPLPLTTGTGGSSFTSNVTTGATSLVAARTDASNYFGNGTGNKVLHLVDGNGPTAGLRGPTTSTSDSVIHLSFEFYDPSTGTTPFGETVDRASRVFMTDSDTGGSLGNRSLDLMFSNGNVRHIGPSSTTTVGTYSQDAPIDFDIILNFTDEAAPYYFGGGPQTVGSKTYDIYVNGVLASSGSNSGDDRSFRNTAATLVSHFGFTGEGNSSVSEGYVDNIVINDSAPSPLKLTIDRLTGQATLQNSSSDPVTFIGYEMFSTIGALDPTGRKTITDNYDAGSPEEVDPNDDWFFLPDTEADFSNSLAEYQFGGAGQAADGLTLSAGQQLDLGASWIPTLNESELSMVFQAINGVNFPVAIEYVGNGGEPLDLGDLNHDGMVDTDDWVIFNSNDSSDDLSFTSIARAYGMGDLDGDLDIDTYDYRLFEAAYDLANGSGSFLAMLQGHAVPEPSTLLLVALGLPLAVALRHGGAALRLGMLATVAALLCPAPLHAQSVVFGFPNNSELDGNAPIGTTMLRSPDGGPFNRITLTTTDARAPEYTDSELTWDGTSYLTTGTYIHSATGLLINNPGAFSPTDDDGGFNQHEVLSIAFNRYVRILEIDFSSFSDENGDQGEVVVENMTSPVLLNWTSLGSNTSNLLPNPFGSTAIPAGTNITFTGLGSYQPTGLSVWRLSGITVEEIFPELTARVNSQTGEVLLTNTGDIPLAFDSYDIRSSDGALKIGTGGWNSLSDQGTDTIGPGIGESWDEAGNNSSSKVVERFLSGQTALEPGEFVSIGNLFDLGIGDIANLSLVFSDKQTHLLDGFVELFTPSEGLPGDFNNDGTVNLADYTVWRDNLGAADDSALNGNGDGIPGVDTADYNLWKTHFGTSAGAIAEVGTSQVPEPSTVVLAGITLVGLASIRHRVQKGQVNC